MSAPGDPSGSQPEGRKKALKTHLIELFDFVGGKHAVVDADIVHYSLKRIVVCRSSLANGKAIVIRRYVSRSGTRRASLYAIYVNPHFRSVIYTQHTIPLAIHKIETPYATRFLA